MATAHINGIDIHYERSGDGPRLLYLNGSGATLEMSKPMVDVFRSRFDVLAHDQRGLGKTSIPKGPYTMAGYAEDAAALAASIGWDSYRVVGVSFGGMVAQELAVTYPERIERLALLVTSCGGAGGASFPLDTLEGKSDEERAVLGPLLLDTRFTPEWLAEHESDRALADVMVNRTTGEKSDEVKRGERLQLLARKDLDVYDRLPGITCPTLVASGRYDGIAPPENGRAIADRIPNGEFRMYDGGHAMFAQDPRVFPEVLDFLAG